MYIYLTKPTFTHNGEDLEPIFIVGAFTPNNAFEEDSTHIEREEAAARVHYLNGGSKPIINLSSIKYWFYSLRIFNRKR